MSETGPLISIRNLVRVYDGRRSSLFGARARLRAVDGVSLDVPRGHTLGIVGESGCGKSTLARMMVGLLPPSAGEILIGGRPIGGYDRRALSRRIQMVFQDPTGSLNPRRTVRRTLEAPLAALLGLDQQARTQRIEELMGLVGLRADFADRYPHEFSGGQSQRIGIARALAAEAEILVLDEPVSALDVSVQAQVLALLQDLQRRLGLSYVFISHDLAVVDAVADEVAVMQRGRVVEFGSPDRIFTAPTHAYTRELLASHPGGARA